MKFAFYDSLEEEFQIMVRGVFGTKINFYADTGSRIVVTRNGNSVKLIGRGEEIVVVNIPKWVRAGCPSEQEYDERGKR